MGHISRLPHPSGYPIPAGLGEVGPRVRGAWIREFCLPFLPRSGPVSQPCSPSSSVSPFLFVFSPLCLFLTCLSLHLHLALFTSVPLLCPSPLTSPPACVLLASFVSLHPSLCSSLSGTLVPRSRPHDTLPPVLLWGLLQLSFPTEGPYGGVPSPCFPSPQGPGQLVWLSLGLSLQEGRGSWSPAI